MTGAQLTFRDRIDPQLATVVERIVPVDLTDVEGTRARRLAQWQEVSKTLSDLPGVLKQDRVVQRDATPDLPLRVYRPGTVVEPNRPCLLWIHGGGYVLGTIEQDDQVCQGIVDAIGCIVVSVDWRRAPDSPYPAAADDCYDALRWVWDSAAELGVDRGRLAVGGPSSGGGCAAAVALMARDRGDISLCFQLLQYPMLDDRNETPSNRAVTDEKFWNHSTNALAWSYYLGEEVGSPSVPPYAAAARASHLHGLPPAFIGVGTLDMFLDEDLNYAQRLLEAEVPVELHVYPGAYHAFDKLVPRADISRRFVRDRNDALKRAFQA
jgi:acetyl esterase/lipase